MSANGDGTYTHAVAVAATYSLLAFLCLLLTAAELDRTEFQATGLLFIILTGFELARARAARHLPCTATMRDALAQRSNLLALIACGMLLTVTLWRVETLHVAIRGAFDAQHSHYQTTTMADPYETSWRDATNKLHKVTTHQKEGETSAQHAARHAGRVAELEALYPPVQ